MSDNYYVRIRGRIQGPFDDEKVKSFVRRGQLGLTHEISVDGESWQPAGEFPQFFDRPAARQEKQTSPQAHESLTESTTTQADAGNTPHDCWYFGIGGQRSGPVGWAVLQSMAADGSLPAHALVWNPTFTEWRPVSTIAGLLPRRDRRPPAESPASDQTALAGMPISDLLPVFRAVRDGSWRQAWVLFLAVALMFPLIVVEYSGSIEVPMWGVTLALTVYFSLMWMAMFHWCMDPEPIGVFRVLGAWLITGTLGFAMAVVSEALSVPIFLPMPESNLPTSLLRSVVGMTLAVGIIEEIAKAVSVVVLSRNQPFTPRTIAFLGTVSGLAFGSVEAVFYTMAYVAQHQLTGQHGTFILSIVLRWVCLLLLHATWAGIVGFFVGLGGYSRHGRWKWILTGIMIAAVLHGVYDVGAFSYAPDREGVSYSWLALLAAFLSLGLFVGYLRSEGTLTRQVAAWSSPPTQSGQ